MCPRLESQERRPSHHRPSLQDEPFSPARWRRAIQATNMAFFIAGTRLRTPFSRPRFRPLCREDALKLLLVAVTLVVYLRACSFGFVSLDDPVFVSTNVHVRNGLNLDGIRWAFGTIYHSNWIPLTAVPTPDRTGSSRRGTNRRSDRPVAFCCGGFTRRCGGSRLVDRAACKRTRESSGTGAVSQPGNRREIRHHHDLRTCYADDTQTSRWIWFKSIDCIGL